MPEQPIEAMRRGHINDVPYILGFAEKEGGWRANYVLPDKGGDALWKDFVANFQSSGVGEMALGLIDGQSANPKADLAAISEFYGLAGALEPATEEVAHSYIDAQSESMFTIGIDESLKLHSANAPSPTYVYYLTYPGEHTLTNFRTDGSIERPPLEALK